MSAGRALLALALLCPPASPQEDAPPAVATSAAARMRSWELHQRMARESIFKALRWRAIGPRLQGGRIEAIAVPPARSSTIYAGAGSGNLWRSTNNGLTWTPIFEHASTFAIGDVAIAPSDPDIVWIGSGETQPRHSGYSYAGTGVFKSSDGGRSWRNMGLRDTHHIGKVLIDPTDPDVVYVAAIGPFHSPGGERGVFKSADGGRSWKRVLSLGERTGAVDLAMDPREPRILYAAAWQLIHGEQSAIYRTEDGGRSWTRLGATQGLPAGPLGRIGLAVAPSDPRIVYAFLDNHAPAEGKQPFAGGQVYRSDDRGRSWKKANEENLYDVFGLFGWKFCDVRVSPDDPDEIYILGIRGFHSRDGGRSYERFGEKILRLHDTRTEVLHLDQHELWIDSRNPNHLLLGNDGGLFQSYDRARTWLHLNNLPIGEFYAISTDMQKPYWIYGGTQDNAALYGPSDGEIAETSPERWRQIFLDPWGGGDAFVTLRDPTRENIVYYEHQHGAMRIMDLSGSSVLSWGESARSIKPRAPKGKKSWRFGWYTPFLISHHAPETLYAGGDRLLRSRDRGESWRAISPELADAGGEPWDAVPSGTITTIGESPLDPDLLYAGTEGGSLYRTRNGGASWTRIDARLPRRWVTRVVASEHRRSTVYVALSGYRQDDFSSYLFSSRDRGAHWRSLSAKLPAESVNVVREDPEDEAILYAGTDLGVYVSLDGGRLWHSLCATLPTTPVHDLAVHPRDGELVAATHGRSVFVLDLEEVRAACRGTSPPGRAGGASPRGESSLRSRRTGAGR